MVCPHLLEICLEKLYKLGSFTLVTVCIVPFVPGFSLVDNNRNLGQILQAESVFSPDLFPSDEDDIFLTRPYSLLDLRTDLVFALKCRSNVCYRAPVYLD